MFYNDKSYKFAIQVQPRIADGGTVMNYAAPSEKTENFLESIKYIIQNTMLESVLFFFYNSTTFLLPFC